MQGGVQGSGGPRAVGSRQAAALALPLTGCMTVTEVPNLSETQFLALLNGDGIK